MRSPKSLTLGWALVALALAGAHGEEAHRLSLETPQGRVVFRLVSSETTSALWKRLPLDSVWKDYGGNEKVSYLNIKLPSQGGAYAGRIGDLCYYAPWGNLAIFTTPEGGPEAPGLILLGHIESGAEFLKKPGEFPGKLVRWHP